MDKKTIAIAGTHGTGKTTLCYALASRLKDANPGKSVGLVSEVARRCPYPVNEATSAEAQEWIYGAHIVAELEALRLHDIVVSDRSVLDNLVYAWRAGLSGLASYSRAAAWHARKYYRALVFVRPGDEPISDDGFRSTDRKFRDDIDAHLAGWIREGRDLRDLPIIEVSMQDKHPREVAEWVMAKLGALCG